MGHPLKQNRPHVAISPRTGSNGPFLESGPVPNKRGTLGGQIEVFLYEGASRNRGVGVTEGEESTDGGAPWEEKRSTNEVQVMVPRGAYKRERGLRPGGNGG